MPYSEPGGVPACVICTDATIVAWAHSFLASGQRPLRLLERAFRLAQRQQHVIASACWLGTPELCKGASAPKKVICEDTHHSSVQIGMCDDEQCMRTRYMLHTYRYHLFCVATAVLTMIWQLLEREPYAWQYSLLRVSNTYRRGLHSLHHKLAE